MNRGLLLVGSIPLDSVEDVLETFGKPLAPHLHSVPDGEVGPRSHWISRLHYQVLCGHPELETVRRPKPDNGVERLNPRDAGDSWQFRVRPDIDKVRFGDPGWRLGFTRDAVNSYFVFKTMRDQGKLARHLRFQVSLPSVHSSLPPRVFPDKGDVQKVWAGYKDALIAELDKIIEKIPNHDLAIQWDCANEVQDVYGGVPGFSQEDAVERNAEQFHDLSSRIPEEVELGYHFCFGTLGGWPRFQPSDLTATVALANATVEASGRRVDWIHIPILDNTIETFFAPLASLKPQGARVYLGVIHTMERFDERIRMARKYLSDFGLAAYCGFGRRPASEMPAVLEEHTDAIRKMAKSSS